MRFDAKKVGSALEFFDLRNGIIAMVVTTLWLSLANLNPDVNNFMIQTDGTLYPHIGGISFYIFLIIGIGFNCVILIFIYILKVKYNISCLPSFNLFTTMWGLLFCVSLSNVSVSILKNYVSRPRPDTISRCGYPEQHYPNCTKSKLQDQFKSWPSGHTATIVSSLIYMAMFFSSCRMKHSRYLLIVSVAYLLASFKLAATRIVHHRHHFDDVMAGSLIGVVFAVLTWNGIYPNAMKIEGSLAAEYVLLF